MTWQTTASSTARDRTRRPGAVVLAVTAALCASAALVDLQVPAAHRQALELEPVWAACFAALVMAWAGATVLAGDPRQVVGWLLSGFGVRWALDAFASAWLGFATLSEPPLPGATLAFVVFQRLGAGLLLLLPLLLVLFPHGRLPVGRWRVAAVAALGATALLPVVLLTVPARVAQSAAGDGPLPGPVQGLDLDLGDLPPPDAVYAGLLRAAYLLLTVSLVPAVAVVVHRLRASTGVDRDRMRWLLWAVIVMALVIAATALFDLPGVDASLTFVVMVMPAGAMTVAIVAPDIVSIEDLFGRTLVYGALSVAIVAIDLAVLAGLTAVLGDSLDQRQVVLLVLLLSAVIYAPLRQRIWRGVRRLLLGDRDNPYDAVAGLASTLETTDEGPGQQLRGDARAGHGVRGLLRRVEVDHGGGESCSRPTASSPPRPAPCRSRIATSRSAGWCCRPAGCAAGSPRPRRAAPRRPGAAGGDRRTDQPPGRRAAGQPRTPGGGARGRAPPDPPRPARRARPRAQRRGLPARVRPPARRSRPRCRPRARRRHQRPRAGGGHRRTTPGARPPPARAGRPGPGRGAPAAGRGVSPPTA